MSQQLEDVKDYYGKTLQTNEDLKTSACCAVEAPADDVKALLKNIHPTVLEKFYGCGTPLPSIEKGSTVLDLGCGSGRDVYLLSQIVGETGRVIGLDMTDAQLQVANEHIDWHIEKFGYRAPNVEFKKGYIEDLKTPGIEDESVDVVISNCVINLSPDKESVFNDICRVLKPDGQLFFSDVFAGQPIPEELQKDKVLLGECLAGAMHIPQFEQMIADLGMSGPDIVNKRAMTIDDADVKTKIGMIDFYSLTVQSFKHQGSSPKGGCC